ncbi:uncharacterized protein LOC114261441 [Camellia sinensis]|uniref:uncharacterized protein LOC114261441 n=1 Tax=Camellia sinensis TaxID=4442 RepID=UPI001035721F|nr:uncharacterized protein LOC114261441 [Camellia sinensis]
MPLYAWESEELLRLYTTLNQVELLTSSREDHLKWLACPSGKFSVSSLYNLLMPKNYMMVPKLLWNNMAPPKVQFLSWLTWKGRLKTAGFLNRIGVLNQNTFVNCVFCGQAVETVNHVLLWCPAVWKVWACLMNWWGVLWVIPDNVNGLLQWWRGYKWRKFENIIWKAIPMAVMWSLWNTRNDVVFNGKMFQLNELCELIKVRIALWVKSQSKEPPYSVQDIIINLQ